ncbi:MAG: hypothetical protein ABJA67_07450 [Chthonomonadales bacterium]
MNRLEVTGDDERLIVSFADTQHKMWLGCLSLGVVGTTLTTIGILAIVLNSSSNSSPSIGLHMFHPHNNHFGFAWLVSTICAVIGLPFFVRWVFYSRTNFEFDKPTNKLTKTGKVITSLDKIEYVSVRNWRDPDGQSTFRLVISYSDGFDCTIDDWYDAREIGLVGKDIARFLDVDLRGVEPGVISDSIIRDLA